MKVTVRSKNKSTIREHFDFLAKNYSDHSKKDTFRHNFLSVLYHVKGVEWFDVGETAQESCFESPLKYYKIGVFTNPGGIGSMGSKKDTKRKFGMENGDNVKLQIMVVSEEDILRGGSVDDCDSVWIVHPHSKKVGQSKLEMFESFERCVPRVR